jgi:hypothetical protein
VGEGKVLVSYQKDKSGETFEKFLGRKEYDQFILVPFERFLHSSFCEYDD